MDCKSLRETIVNSFDSDVREVMRDVSEKVYAFSEIAFQEEKSSAYLASLMEAQGFTVERACCGVPTSFRAEFKGKGPGPSVAILAEYDALPKIGHACGHNLIAASSVGAALALKKALGEIGGRVVLFGTPAEEAGGGKVLLVERGAFEGMDVALIAHPANHTCVASRSLAWEPMKMTFHGRNAHAGSVPHKGVNALNAIIETFNSINALRQHVTSDVRIHGIITKGGDAVNVVPSLTEAHFLVRAATVEAMLDTAEKVRNCGRGAALATGTTVEFEKTGPIYEPMKGNSALEAALAASFKAMGIPYEMGGDATNMGSTDVGNVSQLIPTVHPMFEICDRSIVGHSPEFAEASGSEKAFERTVKVAGAIALTGLELLCDESLMARVKSAF